MYQRIDQRFEIRITEQRTLETRRNYDNFIRLDSQLQIKAKKKEKEEEISKIS